MSGDTRGQRGAEGHNPFSPGGNWLPPRGHRGQLGALCIAAVGRSNAQRAGNQGRAALQAKQSWATLA